MNIAFLNPHRVPPVPSPVLAQVYAQLEQRGHQVAATIPEDHLDRVDTVVPDADLYVLKSHTELALSLATLLHEHGAAVLNPVPACRAAQDKITAAGRLHRCGIPTPATCVTGDPTLAAAMLESGPVVVKPHRGHRGAHVHLIRDAAELAALPAADTPTVVQRYIDGPGEDLKVYVVAAEVFAVRKPFSPTSFTRHGRPVPVSTEVRDLALRTREAFELELFGIDVIEADDGPVVIDVNYFPGYKGVPDVAGRIADVIAAHTPAEAPV